MNLKPVLDAVIADYSLPLDGIHGVIHWARVLENGLRIAEATGADRDVVSLFAVLHDSRRLNESYDPQHGPRAAEFARMLQGDVFELDADSFQLLHRACAGHTNERTHANITVQTCWDADRLDLGRVGIRPLPERLCTDVARAPQTIQWADKRAISDYVPAFVHEDWKLTVGKQA